MKIRLGKSQMKTKCIYQTDAQNLVKMVVTKNIFTKLCVGCELSEELFDSKMSRLLAKVSHSSGAAASS